MSARASLNSIFQRLKLPLPAYACEQLSDGAQEPWTATLTCTAIPASDEGAPGCPERTFEATEPSKKAACSVAADEALAWYSAAGFSVREQPKTLAEAITKAVRAKVRRGTARSAHLGFAASGGATPSCGHTSSTWGALMCQGAAQDAGEAMTRAVRTKASCLAAVEQDLTS